VSERLAVYAQSLFADDHGKAAHGLIRYGDREVVAVVDSTNAERLASDVVPFVRRPVPVVASVAEAARLGATCLAIGVAPAGGKLPQEWRLALLEALELGLDLEAGLHDELRADPEIATLAGRHGLHLRDLRVGPDDLSTPTGEGRRLPVRVVHTVGSDCAIGKMSVSLELVQGARAAGEQRAVFVPTGQIGISIAGWGIAVDHVISDYVAGAAERLVLDGAARGDLLVVEGQGAILHPAYSGVTLGLLHGCAPHALVLCHRAGDTTMRDWPDAEIGPLSELCDLYERMARGIRPARVAAIAVNTSAFADEAEARAALAAVEDETGRPADDAVRFGPERLWEAVAAALPAAVEAT
jgi:uncharacterized NAD-dependent epimerase/dehydratase family protein